MKKLLQKNGFASFIEVLTTGIIFTLAVAGIMASVAALRPESADSIRKLEAAYAAKSVLEELHASVDATGWNASAGSYTNALDKSVGHSQDVTIGTNVYTVNYTVTQVTHAGEDLDLWEVEATVHY